MAKEKSIKLRVMEALQEEAYKGIVRVDSSLMKQIGVRAGDVIEIVGKKKTVGIVDRAYPSDAGEPIIRMDGILRRNAGTGIGDTIDIFKAEIKEAKKITIAPAQEGIQIRADPNMFKNSLLGRAVIKGDIISLGGAKRRQSTFSGSPFEDIFDSILQGSGMMMGSLGSLKFMVVDSSPSGPVIITENTEVRMSSKAMPISEESIAIPDVTYEDIGGLDEEVKRVREMVEIPMRHPELFQKLGVEPPKGVLMHGPPGTGKTLLARAVANESNVTFLEFKAEDMLGGIVGQTEKNIAKFFNNAQENAPAIIFIDEIDSIATRREDRGVNEHINTPVNELLKHLDGLSSRGNVIVIGATNRPNALDPALRRPGRFDREIEFGTPNKIARLEILKIHTRNMPLVKTVNLEKLAAITHGFVGADLEALAKEAGMSVLRKILPEIDIKENEELSPEILEKIKITQDDFIDALKLVRPSALREVFVEKPTTTWNDIGGLNTLKEELKETIEWPLKYKESYTRLGIKPQKGILLYGPPGTGKTLLAKAVANESETNFILVQGSEILGAVQGQGAKNMRKIFKKARQTAPTILFFDELDSIVPKRGSRSGHADEIVNQFLAELDGLEELNDVIIMGATNRPDMLDSALLRPGRFDKTILVGLPNKAGRKKIFEVHTKNIPIEKKVDLTKLSEITEDYNGADIEAVCKEAGLLALRKDKDAKEVSMDFFEKALEKIKPSITKEDMKRYQELEESYMSSARGAVLKDAQQYMG
ncbi:CDC48 family AAA ATPase [archaeon]|jgi:transitional endoplasmic reticulum ATPase|nr:CDC48 family AAA ATPase [archaeon]